jgi:rod shape-determining protein MreD
MDGWRRGLYWVVLFGLGLMVQMALLPQVFPTGYVPNVMVSLVVVLALYESPRGGLALGLVAGMMMDLFGGRLIGLNSLTLAVLGYLIARFQVHWRHDVFFLPAVVGAMSEMLVVAAQWVLLKLIGYPITWQTAFRPLPYWILFALLFTPAVGAILGFRPQMARPRRRSS